MASRNKVYEALDAPTMMFFKELLIFTKCCERFFQLTADNHVTPCGIDKRGSHSVTPYR